MIPNSEKLAQIDGHEVVFAQTFLVSRDETIQISLTTALRLEVRLEDTSSANDPQVRFDKPADPGAPARITLIRFQGAGGEVQFARLKDPQTGEVRDLILRVTMNWGPMHEVAIQIVAK